MSLTANGESGLGRRWTGSTRQLVAGHRPRPERRAEGGGLETAERSTGRRGGLLGREEAPRLRRLKREIGLHCGHESAMMSENPT